MYHCKPGMSFPSGRIANPVPGGKVQPISGNIVKG
jgi:hypothetical protein